MPRGQLATTIADALARRGSKIAFGVPGGGANLDLVGALHAHGIRFVLAHGETAACIMASTYGHLTRTIAASIATRGPGAASAVNGAAQATLDRHPLLLVSDTVSVDDEARVGHQRIDQQAMLDPVAKLSFRAGDDLAPETLDAALDRAQREPPGAVHLDYDPASPTALLPDPSHAVETEDSDALDEIREMVDRSERPIVIVGRGAVPFAGPTLRRALEALGAPVFTTYQANGALPTEHPQNAGLFTNARSERPLFEQADLIVTLGFDPVEPMPGAWTYDAPVVSIAASATAEPYAPIAVEVVGSIDELAARLLDTTLTRWSPGSGAAHRESVRVALRAVRADLGPIELVAAVNAARPDAVTTTVDAGAHFLAVMPFWETTAPDQLLISNGLATMGYAIPAAIGAALARPGRPVLAFVGDGGMAMTLAELETIARLDLPITVVVLNDSALSLIRLKQNEHHGGDDVVGYLGTDFAAAAQALQLDGTVVKTADELDAVLPGGWHQPRLIDARIDPAPYQNIIAVTRG